jgi:3'-5' exonuclease
MNRIVFDIETLGYPLDSFDEKQQEYLLKFATTDAEKTEAIQKLNLAPLTARIIAIGMLNPDSHQGKVLYDAPDGDPWSSDDGLIQFVPSNEEGILENFWKAMGHYGQFITFNGRGFDCPFIMVRSAILGVKATKNLMPYRYSASEHCDLLEQLTFYGALRKFNLDFYCKAFNIDSPKESGITGLDLGILHAEGRFGDIAEYCIGDVRATAQLFHRWQSTISFEK